ncbi:MAG: PEP-CTERM sorting domain-containing protein [Gammaproteobacteria bacterium]|nr:PEP-CTERM sorting domain-containing protein [Gammaproteobacteria bacterium]
MYATLANGLYLNNISYSNSLSGVLTQRGYADAFGGGGTGGQNWSAGGYMGFTLGGNQGWLQLTYSPFTLQLGQFAYEDTGAAISAGHTTSQPIPEPGTLFTLALGAAGLLAWRAHREKQAKKEQQDAEKDS